jgi:tetratricopeptide (TPR) repeat protein
MEHLEQGTAHYDSQQHRSLAFLYGQDLRVFCQRHAALALWCLGYPDQALKRINDALTLAREFAHPFSLAFALVFAAWLHHFRREEHAARERAEALIVLCSEQGFTLPLALGTIQRGWALAEQGQGEEGIAQMCQALTAWQSTGAELGRPHGLALLAEAYGKVGQAEACPERSRREGLTVLAEALDVAHRNGDCSYEAELYRLKGELLRQKAKACPELSRRSKGGSPLGQKAKIESEAEECFRQAIEVARRQGARSLELRAVMSLSRLWQSQGKGEEARQMLAEIYAWFTEGFDTADLKEAKALLEELTFYFPAATR